MSGLLELEGIRQHDKPQWLASQLALSYTPVTFLLRDKFGIHLRPVPVRTGGRGLDDGEAASLNAPAGTPCRWRTARLQTTTGQLAYSAFLLWLPGLISELDPDDPAACAALDAAAEPAGTILDRLPGGMHREYTAAVAADRLDEITGETRCVASRAVLFVGGQAVGIAEENFMREFVESLA